MTDRTDVDELRAERLQTSPVYCRTLDETLREMAKRRAANIPGLITRYERSPYGGYRVYSTDVEMIIDEFLNPVAPNPRAGEIIVGKRDY